MGEKNNKQFLNEKKLSIKTLTNCPVCEISSSESQFIISDFLQIDEHKLFYSVDLCKRCGAVYTKERYIYPELYTKKYDPEKEHGFQSSVIAPLSENIWNYKNKMLQVEELGELLSLKFHNAVKIEDMNQEDVEHIDNDNQVDSYEHSQNLLTPISYLEVGSSDGSLFRLFNEYCKQHNISLNGTLVESSGASEPCSTMENCKVISKSILDESIAPLLWKVEMFSSLYDVAVISHCLEHFDNPRDVLTIVYKILKPNGILYIEVPDGLRVDYSLSLPLGYYHIVNYNMINLPYMINQMGFEVIDIAQREKQPGLRVAAVKKNETDLKQKNIGEALFSFDNTGYIIGKSAILQWERRRKKIFKHLKYIFNTLTDSEKVLIYGAGTHTASILKEFDGWKNSSNVNIINSFEIVDSNPRVQQIRDLIVKTPDTIQFQDYKYIIISSYAYQEEIFSNLISQGCKEDKIVKLYDWIFLWQ